MATTTNRQVPLVLLGVVDRIAAEPLAKILRQEGMVVAVAQGERGCLRVATAIQPDITLLDPRLPRALVALLRAHPLSRHAHIARSQALMAAVHVALADQPLPTPR
jgi:DNA-binding response OmpR family regulator